MRKSLFFVLLFSAIQGHSQNVGIGTSSPAASAKLDITSTNSGLLIPRVALTMTTAAGPVTAPSTSLVVYNTATAADVTPGFYYWNGSSWTRFATGSSTDWSITGNAGTSVATNFLGTTDAVDLLFKTANSEKMRIMSGGNVAIGATSAATKLDVNGDFAMREGTALALANGANGTLAPGTTSFVRLTGPTAAFSIAGFTGGVNGKVLTIVNTTAQQMTILYNSAVTATNGVYTPGGTSLVLDNQYASVTLIYNSTLSRWLVNSYSDKDLAYWSPTGNTGLNDPAAPASYGVSTIAGTENWLGTTDANDVVLGTNNIERFRLKQTNGYVGIGLAAPTQLLHVSGGSILTDRAFAASTVAVAANIIAFTTGANPTTQVRITDNASGVANGNLTYGATAIEGQFLWIFNGDAQSVTFSSGATTIASGRAVGFIYTGGVWRAVSDASTSVTSNWTLLGNSGTNDPAAPATYGTSAIGGTENYVGTTDANDVVIGTNTIERLRVKQTTGNVGIGLAAPAQPLDVYKVVNADKSVINCYASQISTGADYQNRAIVGTAKGGNATWGYAVGVTGLGDMANSWHATGVYAGMSTTLPTSITSDQALYANGENLAPSGVFMNGNVGIGTAFPTQQLEIGGTDEQIYMNSATSNMLYYNTNGVNTPAFTTRSAGTKIVFYPQVSATAVDYAMGIAGSTLWASVPEATSVFMHRWYGGTSELMRLRGDGRLSIGTAAPTATRLHAYDPTVATTRIAVFRNGGADGTEIQIGSVEYFHDYVSTTDFNDGAASAGFAINYGGSAAYDLQLLNNSAAKPGSNAWTIASDSRLKEDVNPFKDGLEVVRAINPVYYKYNGKAKTPKDEYYVGIIAQDMKEIAPYTVGTFEFMPDQNNPDNLEEYYSFNSSALDFVTLNAIKELDEKQNKVESVFKNISDFGMIALSNGETFVPYALEFSNNLNAAVMPVVTVTPVNSDASVSVTSQNERGFYVKITGTQPSVNVNWIAMAKIKDNALSVKKEYSSAERNAMLEKVKIKPTDMKGKVTREREELRKEKARMAIPETTVNMPKDPIELKPVKTKTR